jgi:DNA-binding transcriptional MocR family regulator
VNIAIDRTSPIPVYLQIRNQLREMILSGVLPPGYRLLPERRLAENLGVNRSTVVSAYRELEADALIESHVGQGTTVRPHSVSEAESDPTTVNPVSWNQLFRGEPARVREPLTRDLMELAVRDDVISLAAGMAAPELYPVEALMEIENEVMREEGRQTLQYGPTEGHYPLRESISRLMGSRGAQVAPEEVIILSGSQQGLDLVARVFLDPGDVVIVEEPTFFCALQVFRAAGARVIGVPVDKGGMRLDVLEPLLARYTPKLIYTLPTFQNPSGTTLGLDRRRRLLDLAYRHQVPILEDDPYGELRYEGNPLPSLKALDQHGYVLYLSTFSKMLLPGLRIGWLAAPRPVIHQIALAKQLVDLHSNNPAQRIIDRYLRRNLLEAQLARARDEYRLRRDVMLHSLEKCAPTGLAWNRPEGGIYLWCRLPDNVSSSRLLAAAAQRRVAFVPGDAFHVGGIGQEYVRLNFSLPTPDRIREGITRLVGALRDVIDQNRDNGHRGEMEFKPIV